MRQRAPKALGSSIFRFPGSLGLLHSGVRLSFEVCNALSSQLSAQVRGGQIFKRQASVNQFLKIYPRCVLNPNFLVSIVDLRQSFLEYHYHNLYINAVTQTCFAKLTFSNADEIYSREKKLTDGTRLSGVQKPCYVQMSRKYVSNDDRPAIKLHSFVYAIVKQAKCTYMCSRI